MKKIYILFLIIFQAGLSFGDVNPGHFQLRLVTPGGEPGVFRVQARAILEPVPTSNDFMFDFGFGIWWDNVAHPNIVDIDMVTATSLGGFFTEESPVDGNSAGSGPPNGKVVNISTSNFFQIPVDWVLNQWVNIGNINICSVNNCTSPAGAPAGITAADFLIQGFTGVLPVVNLNGDEYTPGNGPLPLNLISFKANKSAEKDAYLTWTTANESNTSHFVVQRSFDKNTWTDVNTVGAAGYSIDIRNYELYDANVNSGRSNRLQVYYRLKMFDLDGKNSLSPIQSVVFNNGSTQKANEFLVYPNPATDGVQVEWNSENLDQPTSFEFYDVTGKLMLTQTVSDNTNQEYVDFRNISIQPGVYLLRIMNGTEPIEHKQIVVGQNR